MIELQLTYREEKQENSCIWESEAVTSLYLVGIFASQAHFIHVKESQVGDRQCKPMIGPTYKLQVL